METIGTQDYPDIRGFLPSSLNEWRGRITAVVFLPGCNLRCPFCHGWRLVNEWREMDSFSVGDVLKSLDGNAGWLDGVVISGGEPTLHKGLEDLIDLIRGRGLQVKLHTNGLRPDVLEPLLDAGKLDCLALDFKAPLEDARMSRAGGCEVDASLIRRSFALAGQSGVECEFHTTLCPACVDLSDLEPMAEYLRTVAPQGQWLWQQYNPDDVLDIGKAGNMQFSYDSIMAEKENVMPVFPNLDIRGF